MFGMPNVDGTVAEFRTTLNGVRDLLEQVRDLLQEIVEIERGRDQ